MMQAPPTNALGGKMQQRLIAVPFPGRDRFSLLKSCSRREADNFGAAGWTRASIWGSSVPAGL